MARLRADLQLAVQGRLVEQGQRRGTPYVRV
jgi:hypothetical protein